jgi:hypothetical protein
MILTIIQRIQGPKLASWISNRESEVERGPVSSAQRPTGRESKVAKVKSRIRNECSLHKALLFRTQFTNLDLSILFVLSLGLRKKVDAGI